MLTVAHCSRSGTVVLFIIDCVIRLFSSFLYQFFLVGSIDKGGITRLLL
jgi:hypothetical protein